MSGRFRELRFFGEWRPYQRAALAAFEKARHHGQPSMHLVAPPGSGNTLLGVEMIRRVGRRTLVLAPNEATQRQWPRAVGDFTPRPQDIAGAEVHKTIACLSYQQLCELEDPELVLARLAHARWADEHAAETGMTPEEARREGEAFEGADADQHAREVATILATLKREVARGEAHVELRDMLSASARERVQQLAGLKVGVVLLDECHHLASIWGYVIRAVLGALGPDVLVIGLTATPPVGLPDAEAELYEALLGPVDFTVPTPAVVRDGHLAPYQELVWLTEPRNGERDWLAEHDTRFRELTASLREDRAFADWVRDAVRKRPKLTRAALRYLRWSGRPLPPGAPRGESYRQPPVLEDWLALVEDYAVRCLAGADSPEAGDRYDELAGALRELGFPLTAKGIPPRRSDADRLLTGSRAKADAVVDVLAGEAASRGDAQRALVLCDTELSVPRPDDALTGVIDPAAITARNVLQTLAADDRTAAMRPLLVSERGLRCMPADADVLLEALQAAAEDRFALPEWEAQVDGLLVSLSSSGAEWMPRAWVELATTLLTEGTTTVLVGTRELLGEGWVCAALNVLVDLTVTPGGVPVQQIRGRTLRLGRDDPGKLASNWEIVCVSPGLLRGRIDYDRFVAKHLQLFAPTEDGSMETGPEHAHLELDRYEPPRPERFAALNAAQLARAADRAMARERWRLGTAYRGVELPTLLVRPTGTSDEPPLKPEAAARAVAEALRELGDLAPDAAGSLKLTPHGDGFVRCALTAASQAEGRRFVAALDELCGEAPDAPALLITRPLGAAKLIGRLLRRPAAPGAERLHPVPAEFAAEPPRTEAFARAWAKHVGPGRLIEDAGEQPAGGGYETRVRAVWV